MRKRHSIVTDEPKTTTIKWDEATIAAHDLERGTRQKIEEPDTPFERGLFDDEEDPDEGETRILDASSSSTKKQASLEVADLYGRVSAQLLYVQRREQDKQQEDQRLEAESLSSHAAKLKQDLRCKEEIFKFREKRAGHYGRINLAEMRKIQSEEDD